MHRSESRPAGFVALTMSVFLVALATLLTAHPAAADTYTVTSTACTGAGSITEAMTLANTNPGEDTISFTPGLVVNFASCPPDPPPPDSDDYFALQAEESVIFEGNGAKLQGQMSWITPSGVNNAGHSCVDTNDLVVALTPGVIKVGTAGQDNSGITVTVSELDIDGTSTVALIEQDATLVMEDLTIFRIYAAPYPAGCDGIAIDAREGANFVARRTIWGDLWNASSVIVGTVFRAAIQGNEAGNLTIEDSFFEGIRTAGGIDWDGQTGSTGHIVTSRFDDAGGIQFAGDTSGQIVNSIWASQYLEDPQADERIVNSSSQPLKIIASTLLFASDACDLFCQAENAGLPQPRGWVYRNIGAADIDFVQSAVAVNFLDPFASAYAPLLDPNNIDAGLGFSADVDTWMMQTQLQGTAALQTATGQPALLTDPPASLPTELAYYQERATPLNGGELIASIGNAACTQGNELINPIDNSCITTDALGNPRWDSNDERDIGAVQLGLAPVLFVVDPNDQKVVLHWTKPQDPGPSGAITGYQLSYRETGSGTWIPICVDGADTSEYVVAPLTNGTEYEFQIDSLTGGTCPSGTPSGNPSNIVVATVLVSLAAPTVTATPSVCQTHLSWTEVDTGFGPVDFYTVSYRKPPLPFWTLASPGTTDLEFNVTGLLPATFYEFAVRGIYNGTNGSAGKVTATTTNGGDIDGSGTVTYDTDRPLFLAAYGSSSGDARYLPAADLDCDGRVTPKDYRSWYAAWVADGRVR